MGGNYQAIIQDNVDALFRDPGPRDLERALGAARSGDALLFRAFGGQCAVTPQGIALDGQPLDGPLGVVISLYALHAKDLPMQERPYKAFKEMNDSMPYAGAFATHAENILAPKVEAIRARAGAIAQRLDGGPGPEDLPGDFSMVAAPLPKIRLCYIFYLPDDDFPASVTCLFSHNAEDFMPTDGLADAGEYSSRTILNLLQTG